jgi:peptidyl-prolyl cis-trans isomerase SurA
MLYFGIKMKKRIGNILLLLLGSFNLFAGQDPVLVRINGKDVLRSEFEYQYNKLRLMPGSEKINLNESLNLFIDFKLKALEAEATGIDTTKVFREEFDGYRRQISKSYLAGEVSSEEIIRKTYDKMKSDYRSGQVLVCHIFKRLSQNISSYALREKEREMDSIYNSLKNGTIEFNVCVKNFSDEKNTFWVSWLQMPTEFESVVFDLNPGEFSTPFFTPQGIHIAKVLQRKPVASFEDVKKDIAFRLLQRSAVAQGSSSMIDLLKQQYNYELNKEGVDELFAKGITDKILFELAGKSFTGKSFARFAAVFPGGLRYQLDRYITKMVLDCENSRLEAKYPDLKLLLQEYREGMLVNAISSRKIWNISSDEKELSKYFKTHRSNYNWDVPYYSGIVLNCATKKTRKKAHKILKSLPESEWQNALRLMVNGSQKQVHIEQGLFKPGDNQYVDDEIFNKGKAVPLSSFPFTLVVGQKINGPQSYRDIWDQLVSDYQKELESRWISQLRENSKVEIKQEVLKTVNNHREIN